MRSLFVIPARGGSKGIPEKNIKLLHGKPLIYYSVEFARLFTEDEHICVTTDNEKIKNVVEAVGLKVPFLRPAHLATDKAGTYEVLQHAASVYVKATDYDALVLLQPTSPFRKEEHLQEALQQYSQDIDMVVSVVESNFNPYYNLFEENATGFLRISKGQGEYTRRQDAPKVYEYNGSFYIINMRSLAENSSFKDFSSIRKYTMSREYSIDIDTMEDWEYAEYLLGKKKF